MKSEIVVPNPAEPSKETLTLRTVSWLLLTSGLIVPVLWLLDRWNEWQYVRQFCREIRARGITPNKEAALWAREQFRKQMERDVNA